MVKSLPARQLAAWQAVDNVPKEVEAPQSVDTLFDDELITENEQATTTALDATTAEPTTSRTAPIQHRLVSSSHAGPRAV